MAKDSKNSKNPTAADLVSSINQSKKTIGAEAGKLLWLDDVVAHDYPSAANYLGLISDPKTVTALEASLRKAPIEMHRANDILRAAGLDLLTLDDPSVRRDLSKVMFGERWSPVLVVRGDVLAGVPLTIADGYHRVCASYHLSEDTYIPCKIADLPVKEKA
ncbi:MAG: hypothetical protein V9E85_07635 [Candidatus Nanopelagicales bacterium]|jgi:hypothetical protein